MKPTNAQKSASAAKGICRCEQKPCIHYPGLKALAQSALPIIGRGQLGGDTVNQISGTDKPDQHSVIHIAQIIASLQSLSETLPAVLAVANGWAPCGNSFQNRDDLISAADMLKAYRNRRAIENAERETREEQDRIARERELIQTVFDNGVKTGIEQEQARVKEARKGRRGAKKS